MDHSSPHEPDSLQQLLVQVPRQLLLGVGLVVLAIAGVVAWNRYSTPLDAPLPGWSNVSPQDFDAAQRVLASKQLRNARLEQGTIRVPADEVQTYLDALLPRGKGDSSTEHWADVWQQANDRLGRFSGSHEREAAREIARAQVVSRLLTDLPDIESADVVWDEDQQSGWHREQQTRATVYLRAAPGSVITPQMAHSVRLAVAGSKSHLAPEDVVVFDQGTMTAFSADHESATRAAMAQQQSHSLQRQLLAALDYINDIRVVVHYAESESSSPQTFATNSEPSRDRSLDAGTESASTGMDASNRTSPPEIAVTVSIPEEYLRAVAGLDANVTGANLQSMERRREVFRQVESQVARTVHEKVARLVPGGMTESGWNRISIDTIPIAIPVATVATPVSRNRETVSFATLLNPGIMRLFALLTGLGAISLLVPRRRRQQVHDANDRDDTGPLDRVPFDPAPEFALPSRTAGVTSASELRDLPVTSSQYHDDHGNDHDDSTAAETDEERLDLERRWLAATEAMERRLTAPLAAPRHFDRQEHPQEQLREQTRESHAATFIDSPSQHDVDVASPRSVAEFDRVDEPASTELAGTGRVAALRLSPPTSVAGSPLERALTRLESTATSHETTAREASTASQQLSTRQSSSISIRDAVQNMPVSPPLRGFESTVLTSLPERPKSASAAMNSTGKHLRRPATGATGSESSSKTGSRPPAVAGQRCGGAAYERGLRVDPAPAAATGTSSPRRTQPDESPLALPVSPSSRERNATDVGEASTGIEALADAPIELVRAVARLVPADIWSRALFGASARLKQRILPELPPGSATQVRQTLAAVRPIRLRDIDTAKQYVLEACLAQNDFTRGERRAA